MYRHSAAALLLTAFLWSSPSFAAPSGSTLSGWSTYRGNAARQSSVEGDLSDALTLKWVFRAIDPPQPAWPRSDRMPFDRCFQPISVNGRVFFGSSADGAVYALSAATGQMQWRFFTDGPIRFAPAAWQDRLLVVSDDGHLYALSAESGQLLWKRRGGPDHRSILGNQRMISKWPARGGVAVVDDTAYFAAGIWPSDGIFLYALDAESGQVRWQNDDSGSIYMPQPHGGANANSGVSAQGYLVVSGDYLLVPTGRAVPAAFNRHTGKIEYFHLQKFGQKGGTPTLAVQDVFFNGGIGFHRDSGDMFTNVGSGPLAAGGEQLVRASGDRVSGYRLVEVDQPDRKGTPVRTKRLRPLWEVSGVHTPRALVLTNDRVVSGGDGYVDLVDPQAGKVVWSAELDGTAYGLAVADGQLVVSTDRGAIYCFGPGQEEPARTVSAPTSTPLETPSPYAQAAEQIIGTTGITRGYCLDLDCGDGWLAMELARRTELKIYAVTDDAERVALARKNLSAAGLYGSRVTVHHRQLADTGYPRYFANLIVSGQSVVAGHRQLPMDEARRLQRPWGGVICVGKPTALVTSSRDALPGAGQWTHQYANAANTLNSDDTCIQGQLSMLWFRDIDFEVPQRHGRAPAPLFYQGRLFHEGIDGIAAVDAYNGRELWRYNIQGLLQAYHGDELMGTSGTGSNFCVHNDSVYIRQQGRCLRLDAAQGTLLGEYQTPQQADGKPGTWGYIACVNGLLYGTIARPEHVVTYRYRSTTGDMSQQLTESSVLFALDVQSGELLWQYAAEDSIRHNAIAIGGGKVFLIDRPLALFDRVKRSTAKEHPPGRLVCLDARSGRQLWTQDENIYGTMLALSQPHKSLLMSYQPTRFRLDSERGGRLTVIDAENGERRWETEADYQSRPMINGRTVYAEGGAWDLLSGEVQPFPFQRSYGCGILTGSRNMLLFRSATLGYFDLASGQSTRNFGGVRPGCWVNAIPAGGLVLVPDASAGCQCSYLNKAWFALDVEPPGPEGK